LKKKIKVDLKKYLEFLFLNKTKKLAICIGFGRWKKPYIREYVEGYYLLFCHSRMPIKLIISTLLFFCKELEVFIWSYKEGESLRKYLKKKNISITRVEDGFIRSIGLGLHEIKPLSLVFDKRGLYFNTKEMSDLKHILINKAPNYDDEKLQRAKKLIKNITSKGISKYNFPKTDDKLDDIPKNRYIVLAIGQVEDDMSIKYGCSKQITNLDLLQCAFAENPDAYIIYKPHPDTLTGIRKTISPLSECKNFCSKIDKENSLNTLLKISSHIYTITSLSGFEALMHGKKVTCLGSPFYSGWGLTDDRDKKDFDNKRMTLSLEQLFYAAYVEYPTYLLGNIDKTIKYIEEKRQ